MKKTKLKYAMVGGGEGSFIGAIHRIAAAMDQQLELVAGAFSSTAEKSQRSGKTLNIASNRCYSSYHEMLTEEIKLSPQERVDFIAIVTPNHMHFPVAKAALNAGFHVLSDKPATFSLEEAHELQQIINNNKLLYGITHNYIGYPMVKQAKHLIQTGTIGKIRKVIVEYNQGWLSNRIEENNKQASWRTDPKRSGISGCIGDIGSHAENLAEYISGLAIEEVAADLTAFVDGRNLDDDGNILLRFEGGAKGVLFASQIAAGEENNLRIRIYGEQGGLRWQQQEPNTLELLPLSGPMQTYRAGQDYLCKEALQACRTPPGHPEGYLEGFANIYQAFSKSILHLKQTGEIIASDIASINCGVRSMAFIQAVVDSSKNNSNWQKIANYLNN